MAKDRKFVGSGKVIGNFGQIKLGIRVSDLPEPNERGYINLIVAARKETNEWGQTHFVYVDDFVPNGGKSPVAANQPSGVAGEVVEGEFAEGIVEENLPF